MIRSAGPRRAFLKSLAAAPLLPGAWAQVAPALSPTLSPTPSPASGAGDALAPMADALTDAVRHRYGAHLESTEIEEVRKNILDGLKAAERLRTVKLGNADEPVTTFQARPPARAKNPA